jgi:hypothetical protein
VSVQTKATALAIAESIGEISAIRGPRPITDEELALGVAALTRVKKYGRKGNLNPSVVGLSLSCAYMLLAGAGIAAKGLRLSAPRVASASASR